MSRPPASSSDDLKPVVLRPGLGAYLKETWRRRQFAVAIAGGELRGQHMDSVLGNLWHVLNPLLLAGVYYLVFGVLLDISRGVANYPAFVVIGVFVFHFSQKSIITGSGAVVSNEGLIRSIRFPRAILPLATVVGHTIAFLPAIVVMLAIVAATGEMPAPDWLLLVPILALQAVFNLGAALVVARLTDLFRDVENVLPYVFRLAFYGSGVLYAPARFVDDPAILAFFDYNPFFVFVSLARGPLLGEMAIDPLHIGVAIGWTLVLLIGGFAFFRAGEDRYGRG